MLRKFEVCYSFKLVKTPNESHWPYQGVHVSVLFCVHFFCTDYFAMVPFNFTCLHCSQQSFIEHLFNLYDPIELGSFWHIIKCKQTQDVNTRIIWFVIASGRIEVLCEERFSSGKATKNWSSVSQALFWKNECEGAQFFFIVSDYFFLVSQ